VGKWVFIVNGTKLKEWAELSPRLLGQIKGAEVRVGRCWALRRPPPPLVLPVSTAAVLLSAAH
jgi:hypothetical protein